MSFLFSFLLSFGHKLAFLFLMISLSRLDVWSKLLLRNGDDAEIGIFFFNEIFFFSARKRIFREKFGIAKAQRLSARRNAVGETSTDGLSNLSAPRGVVNFRQVVFLTFKTLFFYRFPEDRFLMGKIV